jgi:hypothetical protein
LLSFAVVGTGCPSYIHVSALLASTLSHPQSPRLLLENRVIDFTHDIDQIYWRVVTLKFSGQHRIQ